MLESIHHTEENVKKKSFVKTFLKIFLWFAGILAFLISALIGLLFLYENDVKKAIINELNTHLNAEVAIKPENIQLSILSSFPEVSIDFKEVSCFEPFDSTRKDTLFFAKKLSLRFNLLDLFNKKYEIIAMKIIDTDFNLKIDKQGKENYIIWKESESSGTVSFKLSKIILENVNVKYKNKKNQIKFESAIKTGQLTGNFNDEEFELLIESNFLLREFYSDGKTWLKNKNISCELGIDVKKEDYLFKNASIKINEMNLALKGSIQKIEEKLISNISFDGKDLDIRSTLSLLPGTSTEKIKDYDSDGNFYAKGTVKGDLNNPSSLTSKIEFGINKAKISYNPSDLELTNLNLKGIFEIGKNDYIKLEDINAELKGKVIQGSFSMSKFNNPNVEAKIKGSISLNDLLTFYPVDTILEASGILTSDLEIKGNLKELRENFTSESNYSRGEISLDNISLQFKGSDKKTQIEKGIINFNNRNIKLIDFKIKKGNSDLVINGDIKNLISWVVDKKQDLIIDGSISSSWIDLDDFIQEQDSKNSQAGFIISEDITMELNVNVSKISLGKFIAKNISGKIKLKDKKILGEDVSGSSLGGKVTISGLFDASQENEFVASASVKLDKIDIKQLFYEFNNFGQNTLTDMNVRGSTSAGIEFKSYWDKELKVKPEKMKLNADLLLEKGQLIDFKPLESLSKYVELKELQNIKFSNLESKIVIENKEIVISKTEIKNSALNLELFGKQDFNNNIDFHLKMLLSEVLAKKPGKSKRLDDELKEVENDPDNRRCVFVHISGTYDSPIIEFDKKGMKEKIKEDLKNEKQNLKEILNQEFGLFKKDSTLYKKKEEKSTETKFEIDFGKKQNGKKEEPKSKKTEEDDEDF